MFHPPHYKFYQRESVMGLRVTRNPGRPKDLLEWYGNMKKLYGVDFHDTFLSVSLFEVKDRKLLIM